MKRHKRKDFNIKKASSGVARMMKWAAVFAAAGAVIVAVIIWGVPFVRELTDPLPSVEPRPYEDPLEYHDPLADDERDFSLLQREALIDFTTISDPYMTWEGILFVSSSSDEGKTVYDRLFMYDLVDLESTEIEVDVKYENILNPMMSDDYIVFIDSLTDGGGRICVLDRHSGEQFTVKEYAFAPPKISMSGNIICFMQQAGGNEDKLYLFDMGSRESVTVRTFEDFEVPTSSSYIYGDYFMYTLPHIDNATHVSTIVIRDLTGADRREYNFSRLAVHPQMDGDNIVFGVLGENGKYAVYLSKLGASPVMIEQNALNYALGEGFVAYTLDGDIYLYLIQENRAVKLNSDISQGVLSSVNGKYVCWYDITGGYEDIDIVKYAIVEW